ncbi:UNVERIFIED_ORG: hypothetical protein J2806_002854 [Kosakonia oryzae]|nr:hypothetical protein [Kosakonia oryzae]
MKKFLVLIVSFVVISTTSAAPAGGLAQRKGTLSPF